ncbi:Gag-Pol polyprotein [Dissostichus eleginoides]|uniref:Gag-Pol polyprotein n=1 Tax=Dissostichus eleginoides TaxID=100907 RepID=A0AAD9ENF1_DISEL|nr:Gag-Pol polyprotein [Dissostichus eleginoides]
MAGRADDGRPIPRVGLRFTLRFQAVVAEEDVLSRTWFCRKVIMEQLQLKVDAIYCLQRNQQERAFDVTLKDEQVYTKVAMDCVAAAMVEGSSRCFLNLSRRVVAASSTRLPLSAWEQIEGTFSTRGSQLSAGGAGNQATWREGCNGASCRFCGQGGHEAKNCTVPKACHGCGGKDHLYRSCPGRRRTFAEVAGANNERETAFEDLLDGFFQDQGAAVFPVGMVETATVEHGPGGGPGTDSEGVGQGLAGDKDSPAAAPEGDKPGARKGSQAFGTEGSEDNGDGTQVGDSKRSKTEGKRRNTAQGESGGRSRWAAEGEGLVKDSDQEEGKVDTRHGLGGG